jgi:hypothetical protein
MPHAHVGVEVQQVERHINGRTYHLHGANADLLAWIDGSPLAASVLGRASIHTDQLAIALGGDWPQERVLSSKEVIRRLWATHPELGPYPFLDTLSEFEFDRMFYAGYRDHVCHQLKVFLLGLMAYDGSTKLRDALDASFQVGSTDSASVFALRWMITAIYHDVGYVLENEEATVLGRAWDTVQQVLNETLASPLAHTNPQILDRATEQAIVHARKLFRPRIGALTELDAVTWSEDGEAVDPLRLLEPEAARAGLGHPGTDALLRRYYEHARTNALAGRPPFRDHGISSAMLLLYGWSDYQAYMSMLARVPDVRIPSSDVQAIATAAANAKEHVRAAASAMALHNIAPKDWSGHARELAAKNITFSRYRIHLSGPNATPLAFLLGIVDTLQDWDRPRYRAPVAKDNEIRSDRDMSVAMRNDRFQLYFPRDCQFTSPEQNSASQYSKVKQLLSEYLAPPDVDALIAWRVPGAVDDGASHKHPQVHVRRTSLRVRRPAEAVRHFALIDHAYTFYPLEVVRLLFERRFEALGALAETATCAEPPTLPAQTPISPAKKGQVLRDTVLLDPLASYALYDLVYRNRTLLSHRTGGHRLVFGNGFRRGATISGSQGYSEYQRALSEMRRTHKLSLSFDIATFFNDIRRDELVDSFLMIGAAKEDCERLRRVLGAAGTLPQGVYPTKVLGSRFLAFMDEASQLRSTAAVRFMDDFTYFDDDERVLHGDYERAQKLLAARGLKVNPQKTILPGTPAPAHPTIDRTRLGLLRLRRSVVRDVSGIGSDRTVPVPLTLEQRGYLIDLFGQDGLSEEDAELVLTLMRAYSGDVLQHLDQLIGPFPNLAKRIYTFFRDVPDSTDVAAVISDRLKSKHAGEYELFWFAALLEDRLRHTPHAEAIYRGLLDAPSATDVTRARVFQIPENRFGMPHEREEQLRKATSDIQSWSAAIGSRFLPRRSRASLFEAFRKGSALNALVAELVSEWDPEPFGGGMFDGDLPDF